MEVRKKSDLKVSIKSRIESIYEGVSYSLTSVNAKGVFDVLPGHANFVALISQYVILDKNLLSEKTYKLEKGLLSVSGNVADVYVDL